MPIKRFTTIMAIDPGQRTGIAVYEFDSQHHFWEWFELGPEPHNLQLFNLIKGYDPSVIICEDFTYRHHLDNAVLVSRDYIGVINLYVQMMEGVTIDKCSPCEVVFQSAATGIGGFWKPKEKLQKLDLYIAPGGRQHQADATRHLLQYLTFTLKDDYYLRKLKESDSASAQ